MRFIRTYARALLLLREERWVLAALIIANILLAALQLVEPVCFGRLIDTLANSGPADPELVRRSSFRLFYVWIGVGAGGVIVNIFVSLQSDRMTHRRRLTAIRAFFEHVLSLTAAYHGQTHSARLLKTMVQGADNMAVLWLSLFRQHISTLLTIAFLVPVALLVNLYLGAMLIALLAVFSVLNLIVVARTNNAQTEIQELHSEVSEWVGDALANVTVIQSFVRAPPELRHLDNVIKRLLDAQYPVLTWWAIVTVLTRAASTLTVIAVFALGTWLFFHGRASVGEIVSVMGFAILLIGRLEQLMGFISRLFFQMHSISDYFAVLDAAPSVTESATAIELKRVVGRVVFENVTLSYDGNRPAVSNLTFEVPAGGTVAIVGPTGAGKSTAMGLLYRMWDPQSGRITIDGTDIRDISLASLRGSVGVVFQEAAIFSRTIADNLRVGRPEAADEEMKTVARLAEAHEFIMAQPAGYGTVVGERGRTLSGGERQRIAIARALLKNPPILILDEATSALDVKTEAKVQKALSALMSGRTTFIIAHRLSTIQDADWVLVMEHGLIVEQGHYHELAGRGGAFAKLLKQHAVSVASQGSAADCAKDVRSGSVVGER